MKKIKILFAILFIIATVALTGVISINMASTGNCASVYNPGIETIKALNNTGYEKYIQKIYINPKEKNKLMILIKPNYWEILSQKDKNRITEKTFYKWKQIYAATNNENTEVPEVCFANK